jgi:hypothetical protein
VVDVVSSSGAKVNPQKIEVELALPGLEQAITQLAEQNLDGVHSIVSAFQSIMQVIQCVQDRPDTNPTSSLLALETAFYLFALSMRASPEFTEHTMQLAQNFALACTKGSTKSA